MKSFFVYFIVAFIGFAIADYFMWPSWTIVLLLLFVFTIWLLNMLYILYGSKNMKQVEKFLAKNRKEPVYSFVYEQAHGSKEDLFNTIEKILKKYPTGFTHQNFRFVRELLQENYTAALEEAENIRKESVKLYSKALVYANEGKREQALSHPLQKEWMSEAILATISKVEGKEQDYKLHKEKAIEAARGIQRYSLIHSL